MKKLLAVLILLSGQAYAGTVTFAKVSPATSFTNIQHTSCNANTFTGACAFVSGVTAHSLLVSGVVMGNSGVANALVCQDNNGNTWHEARVGCASEGDYAGTRCANIWYALNANAGATTVTCHDTTNAATVIQQSIGEYGSTAAAAFDVSSSSSPFSMQPGAVCGTINTAASNEFIFAYATLLNGAVTGQSGTLRENYVNNFYQATEDTVVALPSAYESTFTMATPSFNVCLQAAFK